MFRNAFRKHRCLILADSYFEWKRSKKGRSSHIALLSMMALRLRATKIGHRAITATVRYVRRESGPGERAM
jgi:SOS response associated peptidase (SRAP)